MNKRLLFISTALLINNLAIAVTIPVERSAKIRASQNVAIAIHKQVENELFERGLDKETAKLLSQKVLNISDKKANAMIETIFANCPSITMQHLSAFISESAIHRKKVDLSSYGTLVRIYQNQHALAMDESVKKRLNMIANLNRDIAARV